MNTIIISLGGSIISTAADTTAIVRDYATWLKQLAQTHVVAVIVGGGYRARIAIEQAKQNNPNLTNDQLDEVGIAATQVNAELLRSTCQIEHPIITDPNIMLPTEPGLVFGAGWKPGRSTDYDAVLLAVTNQVDTVYNVSNITKIFTADPKIDPTAKPL
ncbi:MAG: UMP kinase, partial [Candidatus Kerfeldbacteria bacterium]|nr:UMP kinase [Candidatus Kerfeldbacteria bacterium]